MAQADEWDFALGTNPRLHASYEQAELRLVEEWAGSQVGPGRRGGHARCAGACAPAVTRAVTRPSSCAAQTETVGFFGDLCMRPWSANPRWVPSFDDFPLTSVEVKAALFRQAAEEGWTVVLSHEPRQPVGRFVADRDRYRFEPTL